MYCAKVEVVKVREEIGTAPALYDVTVYNSKGGVELTLIKCEKDIVEECMSKLMF